jgi:hypothetical protein
MVAVAEVVLLVLEVMIYHDPLTALGKRMAEQQLPLLQRRPRTATTIRGG